MLYQGHDNLQSSRCGCTLDLAPFMLRSGQTLLGSCSTPAWNTVSTAIASYIRFTTVHPVSGLTDLPLDAQFAARR
jgi:hypothetical protein